MKLTDNKKPLSMGILKRLNNQFYCLDDKVNYATVKGFTPQLHIITPIF